MSWHFCSPALPEPDGDREMFERYTPARTAVERGVGMTLDLLARPTARWRPLPDYLIIGAQRAGTTTLQRLLARHPEISGPRFRKGLHYFDTGFDRDDEWYRSQFPISRRGGPIVGEASPYYLFHPLVPQRIADLMPDVKLIALLRDPVERAISHHRHETRRGYEHLPLEEALDREDERLAGEVDRMLEDPTYVGHEHQHHSYVARGRYAEQLERYRRLFPPERLLLVESETAWESPDTSLQRVLEFLDVSMWAPDEFLQRNATNPTSVSPVVRDRLATIFTEPNARLKAMTSQPLRWL